MASGDKMHRIWFASLKFLKKHKKFEFLTVLLEFLMFVTFC
jgi:hypothetical protein